MAGDDRRAEVPGPPHKGGSSGLVRQLADALDLPFVLVGSVIVGAGLGYLLDLWWNTSPVFALVLGAGGFVGGFLEILRRLNVKRKRHGQ